MDGEEGLSDPIFDASLLTVEMSPKYFQGHERGVSVLADTNSTLVSGLLNYPFASSEFLTSCWKMHVFIPKTICTLNDTTQNTDLVYQLDPFCIWDSFHEVYSTTILLVYNRKQLADTFILYYQMSHQSILTQKILNLFMLAGEVFTSLLMMQVQGARKVLQRVFLILFLNWWRCVPFSLPQCNKEVASCRINKAPITCMPLLWKCLLGRNMPLTRGN